MNLSHFLLQPLITNAIMNMSCFRFGRSFRFLYILFNNTNKANKFLRCRPHIYQKSSIKLHKMLDSIGFNNVHTICKAYVCPCFSFQIHKSGGSFPFKCFVCQTFVYHESKRLHTIQLLFIRIQQLFCVRIQRKKKFNNNNNIKNSN